MFGIYFYKMRIRFFPLDNLMNRLRTIATEFIANNRYWEKREKKPSLCKWKLLFVKQYVGAVKYRMVAIDTHTESAREKKRKSRLLCHPLHSDRQEHELDDLLTSFKCKKLL